MCVIFGFYCMSPFVAPGAPRSRLPCESTVQCKVYLFNSPDIILSFVQKELLHVLPRRKNTSPDLDVGADNQKVNEAVTRCLRPAPLPPSLIWRAEYFMCRTLTLLLYSNIVLNYVAVRFSLQ